MFATIDEYIDSFPQEQQDIMRAVRKIVHEEAPGCEERMSWQMPTFHQKANLVHFAAHKHHLGLYPGAEAMVVFADKMTDYKTSKGAVQFPYKLPIPYDLIREIVKFRVKTELG